MSDLMRAAVLLKYWGYVLDDHGLVIDGTTGTYLLASPFWKCKVPPGIRRAVRGESDLLGTLQ